MSALPVVALSVPMLATDAGQQHYLKSSFGMANKRAPQQQQPAAGRGSSGNGRSAAGSGSSTPNSLCGVSMLSDDVFRLELAVQQHDTPVDRVWLCRTVLAIST